MRERCQEFIPNEVGSWALDPKEPEETIQGRQLLQDKASCPDSFPTRGQTSQCASSSSTVCPNTVKLTATYSVSSAEILAR